MKKFFLSIIGVLFMLFANAQGYQLTLPDGSQRAQVVQRVGITDITVVYHSPGVKGRQIFGGLVPYGQVWRAGANENTTISFTHDVSIQGHRLSAGTYGLHMIPAQSDWTIIFSKNDKAWGSFFYSQDQDALRVTAKPQAHEFTEWLTYAFNDRSDASATLSLLWDKVEVPVKIDVDVKNIVINNLEKELTSVAAFYWQSWYDAASYTDRNNVALDKGLKWINTAEQSNPGFTVLSLKSSLLEKKGDASQARLVMDKALNTATESELNAYGYRLMSEGKHREAMDAFRMNVKKHPDSWNTYDSLGEALAMSGDKKAAIGQYALALKKAPADQKERITKTLQDLK